LEEGELTKIAGLCQVIEREAGSIILRAGERGDVFYMIMNGRMDIYSPDQVLIGHVETGDFLGEISLVKHQPYNATAVAASDVQLVVLKQKDFETLIDHHPRIGMKVMRNIAISVGDKLNALGGRFSQEQNNQK
jgi:cAMP-dependent protein kinase regulator